MRLAAGLRPDPLGSAPPDPLAAASGGKGTRGRKIEEEKKEGEKEGRSTGRKGERGGKEGRGEEIGRIASTY